MQISQCYQSREPVISFELFPPKTEDGEAGLFEKSIPALLALSPTFMTCTYGAGGSTRRSTLRIVTRLQQQMGIDTVAHLSCLGMTQPQIEAFLARAKEGGVTNIVALRGDKPAGDTSFNPGPDTLKYAIELVRIIKAFGGFEIAVAGYPEGHPECPDKLLDWQRSADKIEAGANVLITQLFYDNQDFFAYEDHLRNKLGVTAPIVPGVLPIMSAAQITRICGLCGAKLPPRVRAKLEAHADDDEAIRQFGVELATEMCDELLRHGVPGIHFYTLNRGASTAEVMRNLGLAKGEGRREK